MQTDLGTLARNTQSWNRSMVEKVIRYFHDPNGPSERNTAAMRALLADFRRFERIVQHGGVERGEAKKLAWGFIKYERAWLKERPALLRLYQETLAE